MEVDVERYVIDGRTVTLTEDEAWKFGKHGFKRLRTNAKTRGIPFTIPSKESLVKWWMSTPDVCEWCGVTIGDFMLMRNRILKHKAKNPLILKLKKWLRNYNSRHLTYDRIDSEGAYDLTNIVKSCPICNNVKGFLIGNDDMKILGPKLLQRIHKTLRESK